MGGGLGWVALIGMVAIIAVVFWAMSRNKADTKSEKMTEDATRRLYDEQDADDKARDEGRL